MDIKELTALSTEHTNRQDKAGLERLKILMHGQSEVLEMISADASLPAILETIVNWVELQATEPFFASILLLDEEGKRLLHGAAPSLPDEYNQSIHGVAIGNNVGSCGTAAFTKETVIVEDIATDVRWENYKDLAFRFDLHACWSTPLLTKTGKVLGTFAIYYQQTKRPSFDDLEIIKLISRTAVIAIEHSLNSGNYKKALAQSEKRFRSIIEQAPVAMGVLKGADLIIDTANEALLELWGKNSTAIGLPLLQALPEIADQPFPALLKKVMKEGKPYHGYEAMARLQRNGKTEDCFFNFVYAPYYEDGAITGVQVVASEVTEQIIAKKELEQSEKRFRNLIYEAPVATGIYTGYDMTIALANDAMLRLWGKNSSVIGKPLHEGLPELEGQPFLELLRGVYTSGQSYSAKDARADLVVDGVLQPFYFNFTYKPLRNADGSIYAILNMAVDVTESVTARHALQESEERYRSLATELENRVQERTYDLQRANESLEKSNAELAQYAYVASHDLQEPLRKIRVFSSMLMSRKELSEESAGLLSKVMSSADRMSQLISDLLEFSRLLNAGKSMQTVDLNEVLQNVMQDFELSIKEKNAHLSIGLLPVIEAVPLQMNQLFNNLFSNAFKFSRNDVQLQVKVQSRTLTAEECRMHHLSPQVTYYQIIFSDNGIGFDPRFSEQIFEVFKRLHGKQAYPGSGIGLALCRKIVDNHQGLLFARSKEHEGTEFYIVLPERQLT